MAYIKNQSQKQGPISTTGESSIISANTADPNASQAQGTGWTDLKKYLDNNAGLGGGVGDAVTADSQNKIESAAGKINEYQTKAKTANQAATNQINQLEGFKNQIKTDPTKIDANAYKAATSAAYQGKNSAQDIDGYTDAFNAYGTAKGGYDSLKSDDWASRSQAVSDTYGKNNSNYTKGMGMLDTFILQGDAEGKKSLENYVNKNANTFAPDGKDALSTARSGVQSTLDGDKNRWSTLLGDGQDSLSGTLSSRRNEINKEAVNNTLLARDRAWAKANEQVADVYKRGGIEVGPMGFSGVVTPDMSEGANYSADEAALLNALANLDGSAQVKASEAKATVDWATVYDDIARNKKEEDAKLAKLRNKGAAEQTTSDRLSDSEILLRRQKSLGTSN